MNRIFICSDTHGILDTKKVENLAKTKNLDCNDYIIICGDVGIGWEDCITKDLIEFYESLKTNILFIDGNHENFKALRSYPMEFWNGGKIYRISENIRFLERGQIFKILGKTFLAIGGGDSHDFETRMEGKTWFKEEKITKENINIALENLSKHNFKVDYVLSHVPNEIFANLLYELFTQCGEQFPSFLLEKFIINWSGEKLNIIEFEAEFKTWFCGHWHIDQKIDKYHMLYENIVEI